MIGILILLAGFFLASGAQAAPCAPGARCGNIVFDGDSISAGAGAQIAKPDQLMAMLLPMPVTAGDVAVGGRPVRICLEMFDSTVAPRHVADAPFDVIVFHAGDNDVAQRDSAETIYRNFTAYVQRAHRDGWVVVVSTELPRMTFNAAQEHELEAYNRLLVENHAGADAVVNIAADHELNDPAMRRGSAFYSHDLTHPNDAGYERLNLMLIKAVVEVVSRR
jgi:lysophospholipase L1-like esterase